MYVCVCVCVCACVCVIMQVGEFIFLLYKDDDGHTSTILFALNCALFHCAFEDREQ